MSHFAILTRFTNHSKLTTSSQLVEWRSVEWRCRPSYCLLLLKVLLITNCFSVKEKERSLRSSHLKVNRIPFKLKTLNCEMTFKLNTKDVLTYLLLSTVFDHGWWPSIFRTDDFQNSCNSFIWLREGGREGGGFVIPRKMDKIRKL